MSEVEGRIYRLLSTHGPMTANALMELYEESFGYLGRDRTYACLTRMIDWGIVRKAGVQARAVRWGRDPTLFEAVQCS